MENFWEALDSEIEDKDRIKRVEILSLTCMTPNIITIGDLGPAFDEWTEEDITALYEIVQEVPTFEQGRSDQGISFGIGNERYDYFEGGSLSLLDSIWGLAKPKKSRFL